MPVSVNVQTVYPRKLAAVRREVPPGAVGAAWGPALGRSGPSFAASQACGPMATTFFSTTTRLSRARRYCATLVSRSLAHLKLTARCTRPKRKGRGCRRGPPRTVQAHERGTRRDPKMDGSQPQGVRRPLVGDLRRSDAGSGRHGDDGRVPLKVALVRSGSGRRLVQRDERVGQNSFHKVGQCTGIFLQAGPRHPRQ